MHIFKSYKNDITLYLNHYFKEKKKKLCKINEWGSDTIKKLHSFCNEGKMIRGGLVLLGYHMFQKKLPTSVIATAAGLEITQSALLIHDDIMDQDKTRRGEDSVYYQYQKLAESKKLNQKKRFGESMGICTGDISFFLVYEILSELNIEDKIKIKLIQNLSNELVLVGLAQMQDIYFGVKKGTAYEDDIYSLYKHKTARYTFSLPLSLGAILAEQDDMVIDQLVKIGEFMGILFQIRDDEIDLFGDEEKIGKPVGSDLKEDKKTLYHYYLFDMANRNEKKVLKEIFGKKSITKKQVEIIKKMIKAKKIDKIIAEKKDELKIMAEERINNLEIFPEIKTSLLTLLSYINLREK